MIILACSCGDQIPNHKGVLWAAEFTKPGKVRDAWKVDRNNSGSNLVLKKGSKFLIQSALPHAHHLKVPHVTTKRNLTCSFPFFNKGKEFQKCIPTGPNQESCWCGTKSDVDVNSFEKDSRGHVDPIGMSPEEIKDRTNWDFCHCAKPIRDHPIYTSRDGADFSVIRSKFFLSDDEKINP